MTEKRVHAELAARFMADSSLKCWLWDSREALWDWCQHPLWLANYIYHVGHEAPTAPPKRKVTMAGISFNAPESVAPEHNTRYWIPQPVSVVAKAYESYWSRDEFHRECLETGFVHLKEEDAILHAEALIKLSKELK